MQSSRPIYYIKMKLNIMDMNWNYEGINENKNKDQFYWLFCFFLFNPILISTNFLNEMWIPNHTTAIYIEILPDLV